jgi:hypothetical protein
MNDMERLKYLASAEVFSWEVDAVAPAICEGNGPLVVRSSDGEIVRSYPWHCVPILRNGTLYIVDMLNYRRVVGEHELRNLQVQHEPKFKAIVLPRVPRPPQPRRT